MENFSVYVFLFLGGILLDLLFVKHSGDIAMFLMRKFNFGWMKDKQYINVKHSSPLGKLLWNMAGENNTGTTEVKFDEVQQKAVDTIVQQRLAREREKFADYEDLRKFKTEYEKSQDQVKQKELEAQRNYEEAKKQYEGKLGEFSQKLTTKEQEIQNLRIEHALTNEVARQNGFVEESIALLKNQVSVDQNGNISIKGKDANGLDISMPLVDGIKKFYESRPHLVKSTHKAGGGTGAGDAGSTGTGTGGSGQIGDLNYLNAQLIKASSSGDSKQIAEIKTQIKKVLTSKGVGG